MRVYKMVPGETLRPGDPLVVEDGVARRAGPDEKAEAHVARPEDVKLLPPLDVGFVYMRPCRDAVSSEDS